MSTAPIRTAAHPKTKEERGIVIVREKNLDFWIFFIVLCFWLAVIVLHGTMPYIIGGRRRRRRGLAAAASRRPRRRPPRARAGPSLSVMRRCGDAPSRSKPTVAD